LKNCFEKTIVKYTRTSIKVYFVLTNYNFKKLIFLIDCGLSFNQEICLCRSTWLITQNQLWCLVQMFVHMCIHNSNLSLVSELHSQWLILIFPHLEYILCYSLMLIFLQCKNKNSLSHLNSFFRLLCLKQSVNAVLCWKRENLWINCRNYLSSHTIYRNWERNS